VELTPACIRRHLGKEMGSIGGLLVGKAVLDLQKMLNLWQEMAL
jgi:hypothetical protein